MTNSEIERKMWYLLKEQSENECGRTVRLARKADQSISGINKHQSTDIVKNWANRGLVGHAQNGTHVWLTPDGVQVDDPTNA